MRILAGCGSDSEASHALCGQNGAMLTPHWMGGGIISTGSPGLGSSLTWREKGPQEKDGQLTQS